MIIKSIAFAAGIGLASMTGAMAETTGISSPVVIGPECGKGTVGGVTYAWPVYDASMTSVFQSSADNNRVITVRVASDLVGPNSPFPSNILCNDNEVVFPRAFVAG